MKICGIIHILVKNRIFRCYIELHNKLYNINAILSRAGLAALTTLDGLLTAVQATFYSYSNLIMSLSEMPHWLHKHSVCCKLNNVRDERDLTDIYLFNM